MFKANGLIKNSQICTIFKLNGWGLQWQIPDFGIERLDRTYADPFSDDKAYEVDETSPALHDSNSSNRLRHPG